MFRFAIITDTHIRAPGGDLSSPFPVNEKANGRARYACELIASEEPDFTVHLGDMVHPLPHMEIYQEAVKEAHSIFEPLKPSLYFVPGNHDIGDKPSPGMPAKAASVNSISTYQSAFGEGHYSFEQKGILFVVINSSLVNSGSDDESVQAKWLEETLQKNPQQRKFLFSHYPPFIASVDELDHYDNYAEPGRSWLLELCAESGVEAIFSGHVHHFFYNRYRNVKLHCLPATSFTRQDFAEMFPVAPAPEYGRDDEGKFSVCIVDINEKDYSVEIIPTDGRSKPAAATDQTRDGRDRLKFGTARELVPHLRHAWFEKRHLPYNGPMEEFERKQARNDYPLLRLLQMGIRVVRIPVSDLKREEALRRIEDWAALNFRFVVFCIGLPGADELALLRQYQAYIESLEILSARDDLGDITDGFAEVAGDLTVPLLLSKITTSADVTDPTAVYAHAVSSGFRTSNANKVSDAVRTLLTKAPLTGTSRAVVFQLAWGQSAETEIPDLIENMARINCKTVINIRLSDANPAQGNFSETKIAEVLKSALALRRQYPELMLQCDTFEDVDRGYAPRYGLIDRLGNFRAGIVEQLS